MMPFNFLVINKYNIRERFRPTYKGGSLNNYISEVNKFYNLNESDSKAMDKIIKRRIKPVYLQDQVQKGKPYKKVRF